VRLLKHFIQSDNFAGVSAGSSYVMTITLSHEFSLRHIAYHFASSGFWRSSRRAACCAWHGLEKMAHGQWAASYNSSPKRTAGRQVSGSGH